MTSARDMRNFGGENSAGKIRRRNFGGENSAKLKTAGRFGRILERRGKFGGEASAGKFRRGGRLHSTGILFLLESTGTTFRSADSDCAKDVESLNRIGNHCGMQPSAPPKFPRRIFPAVLGSAETAPPFSVSPKFPRRIFPAEFSPPKTRRPVA